MTNHAVYHVRVNQYAIPWLTAFALGLIWANMAVAANDSRERSAKQVHFPHGSTNTLIRGTIKGYRHVDYQLDASAGQTLTVNMRAGNPANYFNINPPDSGDVSMFIGSMNGKNFEGILPDDGRYVIRVYLMRSAARRNAISDYAMTLSINGHALKPVPEKVDALVPGTRFHARATIRCSLAYSEVTECKASVVRRSYNGTANIVIGLGCDWIRRILFIDGKPIVSDAPTPFTFNKRDDRYIIDFDTSEYFEIPETMIFGG